MYATFWSSPHHKLISAAEFFIRHYLFHNFQYSAVHKRQLEGGCNKVLNAETQHTDYSPKEIPLNHPEWHGNLNRYHPLCGMSYSYVMATLTLHHRNHTKIFVAYDGRGGVDDYVASNNAAFTSVLAKEHPEIHIDVDYKFLDMFLAIHSDFFIQNPRSTFSLQIYIIRTILSLSTVPIIRNNDFYLTHLSEHKRNDYWISMLNIMDAILQAR